MGRAGYTSTVKMHLKIIDRGQGGEWHFRKIRWGNSLHKDAKVELSEAVLEAVRGHLGQVDGVSRLGPGR